MPMSYGERLQRRLHRFFPERHFYIRSEGDVRSFVVTPLHQAALAALLASLIALSVFSIAAVAARAALPSAERAAAARARIYYQRLAADRGARLNEALGRLRILSGSAERLAHTVGERHAALALLFAGLSRSGASPPAPKVAPNESAAQRILGIETDQERLAQAAEDYAGQRAQRLRLALRLAGLARDPLASGRRHENAGGPLIEAKDPQALAAILDVDEAFAARIQSAAHEIAIMRALDRSAQTLPLATPLVNPVRSSPYGARIDPFTGKTAFHPGQDFSGARMTAVLATAPGAVSFTGQRTGYGNVVEVNHADGFMTRYAHLASIGVRPGQRVEAGATVGGMGATGRATGVHLHYEVWRSGKLQDPARFLKAGDYVQQTFR